MYLVNMQLTVKMNYHVAFSNQARSMSKPTKLPGSTAMNDPLGVVLLLKLRRHSWHTLVENQTR